VLLSRLRGRDVATYVEFDFAGDIYNHPAPKVDPDVEPAEPKPWLNTIDADAPQSAIKAMSPMQYYNIFMVSWAGTDVGSGIASYDVYVREDEGSWVRWLNQITDAVGWYTGRSGHSYSFYTVAHDNVGNVEDVPAGLTPDVTTTIAQGVELDLGADLELTEGDTFSVAGVITNAAPGSTAMVDDGDGEGQRELVLSGDGSFNLECTYTDNGIFEVVVFVTDPYGTTISDSLSVTVVNASPVVNADSDQTGNEGAVFSFNGSFTDAGALDIHEFLWDFGDGTTATGTLTPNHVYEDDGTYMVTLTVTDDDGDAGADTIYVTVDDLTPTAVFAGASILDEGQSGSFDASGSMSHPDLIISYEWDWDYDGITFDPSGDAGPMQSHTWMDNGTYTVAVCVTDDDGSADIAVLDVAVNDLSPAASLAGDASLNEGQSGSFDAGGSVSYPDSIVSYEWDWDYDGTAFNASSDTGSTQSHTWMDGGTYIVAVRVTDDDGSAGIATLTVAVGSVGPVAALTGDTVVDEGASAFFDASASTAYPGAIVSYEWDWNYDGSVFDSSGDAGQTQSHAWMDNGTYTVAVRVTDDDGLVDMATRAITAGDLSPVAGLTGDSLLDEGQAGVFDASTSVSWPDAIVSYEWDWSYDGVTFEPSSDIGMTQSHAWAEAGTWTVGVRVADEDGSTDVATLAVAVVDVRPPVVTVDALLTNDPSPPLRGAVDDPEATIIVTVNGNEYQAANNGNGTWTLADNEISPALPDGTYDVQVTATDTAGNAGSDGTANELTIDTVAPAAPTVAGITTDSGAGGDGVTNDNTLVIGGTAEANSNIELLVDACLIGTTTTDDSGGWAFDYTGTSLADGTYSFAAIATDAAGNTSAVSATFTVKVDTLTPAPPVISGITDDTGTPGDGITRDNTLILSGTAEAESTVEVFLGGSSIGTVTANGSGAWTFDCTGMVLTDDTYNFAATAADAAGNASMLSAAFIVVVDTVAPPASVVVGIMDDSGADGDGITNDATLAVSGTADESGTVEVFVNGTSIGTTTADSSGNWSFDYSGIVLADGSCGFTATAMDVAGNISVVSTVLTVTIDTAAPGAPAIAGITDDAATPGDGITNDNTLIFSGTAEADSTVEVLLNGNSIGTVTAGGSSVWTFDYTATSLADGMYGLTAVAADAAGNTSAQSTPLVVVIDTTAPVLTANATVVTVGESDIATDVGTFNDAGVGGVNLSASVGTILDNGNGSWNWSFLTCDGPVESQTVVITAADSLGNGTTTTFDLIVSNVEPIVDAGSDVTVNEGQSLARAGSFIDPGADTWTATVDYGLGDGPVVLALNADKTFDLNCTYAIPGTYTVILTVTDDDNGTGGDTLAVTVNNLPPTVTLTNTTTSLMENTDTTTGIKVADIVIANDALGISVLSLLGVNASSFEISGTELYLCAGVVLDYESNPQLNVTIAVDDTTVGATPDDTVDLAITIINVNEAPTISASSFSVAEDAGSGTSVGTVDGSDPDVGDSLTYAITAGNELGVFAIHGSTGEITVADNSNLDYEALPSFSLTVRVQDSASLVDTATITITVSDVNEVPAVALADTTTSLAENTDTASPIKVADVLVTDDDLGAHVLSLSGPDAVLFEIVDSTLYLKAGSILDYETNPQLDVFVAVDDLEVGDTPDDVAELSIMVTDVPEIGPASDPVPADEAVGVTTTPQLQWTAGTGAILHDVYLGTSPDLTTDNCVATHQSSTTYPVAGLVPNTTYYWRIDETASDGAVAQGDIWSFTTASGVNEAPTVSLTDTVTALMENTDTASRIRVADVVVTDDGLGTNVLSLAGADADLFEIDGSELYLKAGTILDYETTPQLDVTVAVEDTTIGGTPDTETLVVSLLNQASITGTVFVDVNGNRLYDADELGIDGVCINLLGADGSPVVNAQGDPITATTSGGGFYLFEDLDPGTYRLHEVQPTGVNDGAEIVGSLGGTIVANDVIELTLARNDGDYYCFAETGSQVASGDTAGIGFWQNKHGQALITQGGTALAAWLTDNFGNIFGDVFAGADGATVASFYRDQLFRQKAAKSAGPAKVDAQFMALALSTYFTSSRLAGYVGADYGFHVTDTGIGTKIVNVGDSGAAFDVVDGTDLTITQLLLATNRLTDQPDNTSGAALVYDSDGNGAIEELEAVLRRLANEVYSALNEQSGI
jgi:PKD repeat protein